MKKTLLAFILYVLIAESRGYSQEDNNRPKMNFGAAHVIHDPSSQEKNIALFVQGSVFEIQRAVLGLGGTFRYSAGDIASVSIKAKNIKALSEFPFVKRIEAKNPFSKLRTMNDSMLVNNRVLPVHAGAAPLTQAYKGDGVVVGIIDTGLDYDHPDFKTSTGKTRIKFLWDQTLPDSASPNPFGYGQEWTGADINNGKATATKVTAEASYGHGTHVASVATGNGLAINKYGGVAPNADIISVAADLNNPTGIADASKYIYDKAASLGEPCVINVSLGDYYGSHDGKNLEAQLVKNLITAQNGRSYVAAAGNAGEDSIHVGYPVSSDSNFTWFSGDAYIAMYADQADFQTIKFAIGADKVTPYYSFRGNIPFSYIGTHMGVLKSENLYNGANRLCTIESYGDVYMGVNSIEYLITADSSGYFWRLMTTGVGKFDAWTFDVKTANLADSIIYPPLKKYKQPDLNSNMVTSVQCLDEVITVGNYTNRNQYIDYDLNLQVDTARVPGSLFYSSSHGPTRDGRIKPDIAAPGDWTMTALTTTLLDENLAWGNSYLLAPGGYHFLDGGTSSAAPGVAGIAALYLQRKPDANWLDIKNAIINCARKDTFTGTNLPNNHWGYGKANAFASLTGCFNSTNAIYNSDIESLIIYPNPASEEVYFEINISQKSQYSELEIYDLVGKKINTFNVKNSDRIVLKKGTFQNGIYFCTLRNQEGILSTKKLIISE